MLCSFHCRDFVEWGPDLPTLATQAACAGTLAPARAASPAPGEPEVLPFLCNIDSQYRQTPVPAATPPRTAQANDERAAFDADHTTPPRNAAEAASAGHAQRHGSSAPAATARGAAHARLRATSARKASKLGEVDLTEVPAKRRAPAIPSGPAIELDDSPVRPSARRLRQAESAMSQAVAVSLLDSQQALVGLASHQDAAARELVTPTSAPISGTAALEMPLHVNHTLSTQTGAGANVQLFGTEAGDETPASDGGAGAALLPATSVLDSRGGTGILDRSSILQPAGSGATRKGSEASTPGRKRPRTKAAKIAMAKRSSTAAGPSNSSDAGHSGAEAVSNCNVKAAHCTNSDSRAEGDLAQQVHSRGDVGQLTDIDLT